MIIFDLIDIARIRKAFIYCFCILVTLELQGAVFCRVSILGARPFFVPLTAVAIGLFEGGFWGGMFGLLTGIFSDAASSDTTALYTVIFAAIGFLAGLLGDKLVNRRFFSCVIVSALALALTVLCQILPMWIYRGASILALLATGGKQILWSLPFSVPAYFACKAVCGRKRIK